MKEVDIKEIGKTIKQEMLVTFKSKSIGDINNAKGLEFIEKLKKEFKAKYDDLIKKNQLITKETINKILDDCFNKQFKPKI